MGWRRGDAGDVDREEEREERAGEVRAVEVEVDDERVIGGVGMVSLGLEQFEFDDIGEEDAELDKEEFILRVEGHEGLEFGVVGSPGWNHCWKTHQKINNTKT